MHLLGNPNAIGDTPFGPDHACCAIQLMGAEQCEVRNMLVEDWSHDGIGLFDSRFCRVQQCTVRNSLGHGIRIGDHSAGNWITANHCQLNGGVGIYLASQTLPCIVTENVLTFNLKGGIATRSPGHQIKSNLAPAPPGSVPSSQAADAIAGAPSGNITENILIAPAAKAPKADKATYSNEHISDAGTSAVASHNEKSVSRRLRGLDAFD
jgi:hypothetical protein